MNKKNAFRITLSLIFITAIAAIITQEFLASIGAFVIAMVCVFSKEANPVNDLPIIKDKVEFSLLTLASISFLLSIPFLQYETELLVIAALFGLARMIRLNSTKKKKNS